MATPNEQLEAARVGLVTCGEQGIALAERIEESQWSRRAADGGWSPGECFEHLILTTVTMLPLLRAGVQEARAHGWAATAKPFRAGFLAKALCWFLEPPYRMKASTDLYFESAGNGAKEDVLSLWREGHLALDRLILEAKELALDRPMITSPFDRK